MNVASLELCKKLYELSGWDDWVEFDPYHCLAIDWRQWRAKTGKIEIVSKANTRVASITEFICPAYDSGYLLRKLPPFTKVYFDNVERDIGWYCAYANGQPDRYTLRRADTPEDAAAKLAIELLKQGVLTSEHQTPAQASPPDKKGKDL